MDQAVQSIQVADTLAERFRTLSNTVSPGGRDIAGAELRIGEANQIYPEIWHHLDRARGLLKDRGVDVPAFDAIRAEEPVSAPGILKVHAIGVTSSHYAHKSGEFNRAGWQRATAASTALKTAMPEVKWWDLERQQAAEIAAVGSLAAKGNPAVWIGILVVVAAAGGVGYYFATHKSSSAPDQTEKMKGLEQKLSAAPCDADSLAALVAAHKASNAPPVNESTYMGACEKVLAADPCNRANLAQYDGMSGGGGAQRYRDECTSKGGTLR